MMGRLMSLLAPPNNNFHEFNFVYNYKFPTSVSNNFHDNYYFCGYKCKKNSTDKLIFEGDRFSSDLEIGNNVKSLPLSFATDGVKPIYFHVYSHRDSFKIIQSDRSSKLELQFEFDADYPCQVEIFYCGYEKFSNGQFVYSIEPKFGSKHSSIHPSGPNQLFKYEFDNLAKLNQSSGNEDFIPIVVLLSTSDEYCEEKQQFVTHISFDSKSDYQSMTSAQVTVQKLVYKQICFFMQEMYGLDPSTEQEIIQNSSCNSTTNDLKGSYIPVDQNNSNSISKFNDKGGLHLQDCIICMASVRDTMVLPCRHLCLCSNCGDRLLHQSPACPICRSTFRALLQIENLDEYLNNNNNDK